MSTVAIRSPAAPKNRSLSRNHPVPSKLYPDSYREGLFSLTLLLFLGGVPVGGGGYAMRSKPLLPY